MDYANLVQGHLNATEGNLPPQKTPESPVQSEESLGSKHVPKSVEKFVLLADLDLLFHDFEGIDEHHPQRFRADSPEK